MPKNSRKNTQIDNFKNVPRAPIYVAKHTYIHTHINIKKKMQWQHNSNFGARCGFVEQFTAVAGMLF